MVCRLYLPWEGPSADHSRAQIQSAQANGCTVGGYCWLYRGADPAATAREALRLAQECGLVLPVLWFDIEPYNGLAPTRNEILQATAACDDLGTRPGIYTSAWVWHQYYPRWTGPSAACHLWDANYNAWLPPDAGYDPGYGGFEIASGRQWTSSPVDRSVFLRSVTE